MTITIQGHHYKAEWVRFNASGDEEEVQQVLNPSLCTAIQALADAHIAQWNLTATFNTPRPFVFDQTGLHLTAPLSGVPSACIHDFELLAATRNTARVALTALLPSPPGHIHKALDLWNLIVQHLASPLGSASQDSTSSVSSEDSMELLPLHHPATAMRLIPIDD